VHWRVTLDHWKPPVGHFVNKQQSWTLHVVARNRLDQLLWTLWTRAKQQSIHIRASPADYPYNVVCTVLLVGSRVWLFPPVLFSSRDQRARA
jgi:hypothetical protein